MHRPALSQYQGAKHFQHSPVLLWHESQSAKHMDIFYLPRFVIMGEVIIQNCFGSESTPKALASKDNKMTVTWIGLKDKARMGINTVI